MEIIGSYPITWPYRKNSTLPRQEYQFTAYSLSKDDIEDRHDFTVTAPDYIAAEKLVINRLNHADFIDMFRLTRVLKIEKNWDHQLVVTLPDG